MRELWEDSDLIRRGQSVADSDPRPWDRRPEKYGRVGDMSVEPPWGYFECEEAIQTEAHDDVLELVGAEM
jgi:hypothetical protein